MAVTLERIEERVDRLETIFGQFMTQTGMALRRIDRSIERIDQSIERMEAIIAEMKAEATLDRQESARYREESAQERREMNKRWGELSNKMGTLVEESSRDRAESARYRAESVRDREESARYRAESAREREKSALDREESARERREMNKRWGELANKMGTLVEDIIAPSLRRMGQEELGCGEERLFVERISRTRSDNPKLRREFDALYVGSQAVLLNESKSTARPEYAQDFVHFVNSGELALYFPEYRERPVVPVFSSLYIHPDLVTYLTRNGIYAVAMGEEVMQILNLAQLRPEPLEEKQ